MKQRITSNGIEEVMQIAEIQAAQLGGGVHREPENPASSLSTRILRQRSIGRFTYSMGLPSSWESTSAISAEREKGAR